MHDATVLTFIRMVGNEMVSNLASARLDFMK